VSADLSRGSPGTPAPDASCTLRVQAVFKDIPEQRAHELAAELIDRAHELANVPDCECDVDVSVQMGTNDDEAHADDEARAGRAR
jgi:hypothetical protein